MGVFVFLPLVLPLTAWPIARLAEFRLHPRTATRLLTWTAVLLAVCSTLCLALLMVVGTAQLPGNPLPDGWSDPEVRKAVPYDEVAGRVAIPALLAVTVSCLAAGWRHVRVRRQAARAVAGLAGRSVAVLPDQAAYAYALPAWRGGGQVVVSSGMLAGLTPGERRALFAHERAHLAYRHHRFLLGVQLAARANPFLRPLRTAVAFTAERWADEEAAARTGSRRTVALAVGKSALVSRGAPGASLAHFAAGPVPRRVAALLGPAPVARNWFSVFTTLGLAMWTAAAGVTVSALSSANSAVTLFFILHAALDA
ncbi:M56 family peptidase [Streptomyces globosus]|uniref:M56 family peptidase n=1 Tax=Streptomyces globosus TaxID=68209 RepID=A0A344TZI1_9ACTN|nr:M56 family metallopeptidase [Streptomyces globosus]AXE24052.1 M56 family peptidase [Streptomyces globosus]